MTFSPEITWHRMGDKKLYHRCMTQLKKYKEWHILWTKTEKNIVAETYQAYQLEMSHSSLNGITCVLKKPSVYLAAILVCFFQESVMWKLILKYTLLDIIILEPCVAKVLYKGIKNSPEIYNPYIQVSVCADTRSRSVHNCLVRFWYYFLCDCRVSCMWLYSFTSLSCITM